jgi:moderate conductance mechanosensitive channel
MSDLEHLASRFFSVDAAMTLGVRGLRLLMVFVGAWVLVRIVRRLLPRVVSTVTRRMSSRSGETEAELLKRTNTLSGVFAWLGVLVVWGVSLLMGLRELGFDIAPILAGAGVVGLAVGFGAQNLVRDVISGAFILLENQVRVGDVVTINGVGGAVEGLSLRTITIRSLDGTLHVFPNGSITTLANQTHEFSYYVFETGIAYAEDTDRVAKVLEELGAEMEKDEKLGPDVLAPLEILGVDAFQDSAVVIKSRIKTKPSRQWAVGREMNRRIKKRFDALSIEFPFPQRTISYAEGAEGEATETEAKARAT